MSLIKREALYEKACDLEAQALSALSYVGKIANDEIKIEEWRIWSAILTERTAFKHDVFDAPDAKPERTGKWIKEKSRGQLYQCSACGNYLDFRGVNAGRGSANYCPNCGARMEP